MSGWWIGDMYQRGEIAMLISWIFWVLFSITLHELAHGWAALWQGDETPRRLNRLTPNPFIHMGGWSLAMFALIGIAWGVMPTDPSKYRWKRKGRIVVAGAGPAMNLLLAFISLTLAAFWKLYGSSAEPLHGNLMTFFMVGGWLNIVLALFNLLPIPPLDGSQIIMGLSFRAYRFYQNPQFMMIGMFIVLVIFFSGLGSLFFGAAITLSHAYTDVLMNILS